MKKITLIASCLFIITNAQAQINLVTNSDFEDTLACPSAYNQLPNCTGWYNAGAPFTTPDYYNVCSTSPDVSVPTNPLGYQHPRSGNGYLGLLCIQNSGLILYTEIAGTQLSSPLLAGTTYYVSFFASLSGGSHEGLGCNKLGVMFSVNQCNPSNPAPVNNFAHVYADSVVNDTANWYRIAGSFTADSAYSYFNIGLFYDMQNIDTTKINIYSDNSYYYIDDVCVSTDLVLCYTFTSITMLQYASSTLTLTPNPTNDILNITLNNPNTPITISITDIIGKQIFTTSTTTRNQKLETKNFPAGIYFVKVITGNETLVQKFVKE